MGVKREEDGVDDEIGPKKQIFIFSNIFPLTPIPVILFTPSNSKESRFVFAEIRVNFLL